MKCKLCTDTNETQEHLFECTSLKSSIPELAQNTTVKYQHIFGNISEMKAAVNLLKKICEERESQIESLN